MPLTLPPLSRRQFLAGSLAATLAAKYGFAAEEAKADANRFMLMADTHIPSRPDVEANGVKMHDNFVRAAEEIIALKQAASAAFILGDCAYLEGKTEDYALLVKVLEPLRKMGLPIHLTMGNHDHRERFWKAIPADGGQDKLVDARHLMIVESPRANWFLLDTLDITNKAPGAMGEAQLAWLAKELDARADKPALVAMHHNPDLKPMPGGLTDTQKLYDVLLPRKHVKALFYGHTHVWNLEQKEGLHLVNLPPVAYVFRKDKPSGFVDIDIGESSATLRLTSLAKDHAQHGQEAELKWRT